MNLTGTTLLGSAGLVALVTALWDRIKLYWSKIWGLVFVRTEINGEGAMALQRLLVNDFKRPWFDTKCFTSSTEYVRPKQKNQVVAFQVIHKIPSLWWRGWRPIIVSDGGAIVSFIRGTFNAERLLAEALDRYNSERSDKQYKTLDRFFVKKIYGNLGQKKESKLKNRDCGETANKPSGPEPQLVNMTYDKYNTFPLQWRREELGQPKKENAISDMSLNDDALEAYRDALRWRESEDWFKERSVPWKRGFLFYGDPGTGKTAFTRVLGQGLNMPILSFDLATMSNADFNDAWNLAKSYSPCIVLLEDIDGVFEGRKNISSSEMERGLSFDCMLNLIDGVENSDGIFIIVTTNDITKIDPAIGGIVNGNGMSTRPGRIDKVLRFLPLNAAGRKKMAERILGNFDVALWEHLLNEEHRDTGAQFQERCCKLALNLFWEGKQTTTRKAGAE